jgi:hypothetical protein
MRNNASDCLGDYLSRKQTRYTHREEIQRAYGYYDFTVSPWQFRLSRLLYSRAWISNERPSLIFDVARLARFEADGRPLRPPGS